VAPRVDALHLGLWVATGLVATFLLAPIVINVLASFSATRTVEFPPQGFSLTWYKVLSRTLQGEPGTRSGLADSLWFSTYLAFGVDGF
jgi:putative spermidine/putrescine transport system permease protein